MRLLHIGKPNLYCYNSVAGNFCELVENKIFPEQTFTNCSLVPPKDTTPPNFVDKTFMNSHKTSKFTQVCPLKSSLKIHSSLPPQKFPTIQYIYTCKCSLIVNIPCVYIVMCVGQRSPGAPAPISSSEGRTYIFPTTTDLGNQPTVEL